MKKRPNNHNLKNIKIGVLGGGISEERGVSLISARRVYESLLRSNLNAVFIDMPTCDKGKVKDLINSHNIGLAFIALHGEFGEDGQIQAILEELNILYTGSGPHASFLAMDKALSKKVFKENGLLTPDFSTLSNLNDIPSDIKYPVVVKPNFSGSSFGISIVEKESDLKTALDKAFSYKDNVILEDYINGKELTVGILEDKPLGVVEIIPKQGYFDFDAKYTVGKTNFDAPAKLEESLYKKIQSEAEKAHRVLGCRHFSRVDFILGKDSLPYILEANSIPGLTSKSLLPFSAKVCGVEFDNLILKMAELGYNRQL